MWWKEKWGQCEVSIHRSFYETDSDKRRQLIYNQIFQVRSSTEEIPKQWPRE